MDGFYAGLEIRDPRRKGRVFMNYGGRIHFLDLSRAAEPLPWAEVL